MEYGFLVVPEDRTQPDSRMIRLRAVVIHSRSEDPKPDPVVFLAGGPGASGLVAVSHVREILSSILRDRDLVVADQRGVGFSEPALDCPEYDEVVRETHGPDVSLEEAQARIFAAMSACRDRLMGEWINLAAYTSATSAADIHDLMQALGYEHYNLSGLLSRRRNQWTCLSGSFQVECRRRPHNRIGLTVFGAEACRSFAGYLSESPSSHAPPG